MQPLSDEEDISFYHESPSLVDLTPEDEKFLMNLSDVVSTKKIKPKALAFNPDSDSEDYFPTVKIPSPPRTPPPLRPFGTYNETDTPEKDPLTYHLKDKNLELFNNGRKKVVMSPVAVIKVSDRRYRLNFHTLANRNNPDASIRVIPYLISFKAVDFNEKNGIEQIYGEPTKSIVVVGVDLGTDLIVFRFGTMFTIGIEKAVLSQWRNHIVEYKNAAGTGVDFEITISRNEDRIFIERVDITLSV